MKNLRLWGRAATLAGTAILIAAAGLLPSPSLAQQAAGANKPPKVTVAEIEDKKIAAEGEFVGRVQAINTVDLVARVDGFIEKIEFTEGGVVNKGQRLFTLERAPYIAALDTAKGQLAQARAQEAQARAQLADAQITYVRQATLLARAVVSKQAVDNALASRDEAKAAVQQAQASEQQAEAQIETAQINLGYTQITAPFAGRMGAKNYSVGAYVGPSSGALATLNQLQPIRVVFSVPSSQVVQIAEQRAAEGKLLQPGSFISELVLPNGAIYKTPGEVTFISNEVDQGTGTVKVYAQFENPEYILLPGQFITAKVRETEEETLPVVPVQAVQRTKDGLFVYLLQPDDTVKKQAIQTANETQTGYAILSGVKAGDHVVVEGLQKIKDGSKVSPISSEGGAPDRKKDTTSQSKPDAS